ncbi:hypothetical protein BH20ACT13_BH20ACT13_14890 [soil metagenome]
MAEKLGLDELRAHALATIGLAKRYLGDPSAGEHLDRALEIALAIDSPIASTIVNNLAVFATFDGDLERTEELYTEALGLAQRFGDGSSARFIRANRIWVAFMRGNWDSALEGAEAFVTECVAGSPHTQEAGVRLVRGSIREARGDSDGALADHLRAVTLARESEDLAQLVVAFALCSATHAERGEDDEARALVEELIPALRRHGPHGAVNSIAHLANQLGVTEELREVLQQLQPGRDHPWIRAALLALDGDFRAAADVFAGMRNLTLEAEMRLHAGEHLIELRKPAEGEAELEKALSFYRRVGATYYIGRAEALRRESA